MTWDAAHHRHIIDTLERVTSGECKRLMIFMPPRHGKSELVTVRYAAWRMRQKPDMNVIIGSYNQRLANRFSRKIKTVLCDDFQITAETQRRREDENGQENETDVPHNSERGVDSRNSKNSSPRLSVSAVNENESPFPFNRPRFKNSESEWETRAGGGLRAVGVGSGVTGFGANLIIVDDPIKSRAEANSIKYRERVHDWFNDDLYTRLEPNGQIILIQTRWHEDDLAGRLLAEENGSEWTVINLPALAEENLTAETQRREEEPGKEIGTVHGSNDLPFSPLRLGASAVQTDLLGRTPGDALWPARFDVPHLENTREKIGSYSFASLYQQHPVPAEGGLFKREWFRHIVDRPPHGLIWKRGYDLGITANATSDHTASYRVAYDKEGILYIDGGYRRRIEYPDQRRYILGRIREELDTEHGIEDTANGSAVVQELRKEFRLQGRAFRAVKPKGDKVTRCLAWMNLAEAGNVRLVRAAWNKEFIDECCAFPLGTHDDQIDAVSIAVAMHARHKYRAYGF